MPKYERSRTAIISSDIGATLLMLALNCVLFMTFYALVAAALFIVVGLVLTTIYRYEKFWPESDAADTAQDRRTLFICRLFLNAGLIIGLVLRLANETGPIAHTVFFAGAILLVSGMILTIRLRLTRYNRRLS